MSSLLWVLRMMWVVAVALNGCDGEEGTDAKEPKEPSLTVTVNPDEVEVNGDRGEHTVTVTVDASDKRAEVELSVVCTNEVTTPEIARATRSATGGEVEWEGLRIDTGKETICTYTAKALGKEATGEFTVKATEEDKETTEEQNTPQEVMQPTEKTIAITSAIRRANSIKISITASGFSGDDTFAVKGLCAADGDPAPDEQTVIAEGSIQHDCEETDGGTYTCYFGSGGSLQNECRVMVISSDVRSASVIR